MYYSNCLFGIILCPACTFYADKADDPAALSAGPARQMYSGYLYIWFKGRKKNEQTIQSNDHNTISQYGHAFF